MQMYGMEVLITIGLQLQTGVQIQYQVQQLMFRIPKTGITNFPTASTAVTINSAYIESWSFFNCTVYICWFNDL